MVVDVVRFGYCRLTHNIIFGKGDRVFVLKEDSVMIPPPVFLRWISDYFASANIFCLCREPFGVFLKEQEIFILNI